MGDGKEPRERGDAPEPPARWKPDAPDSQTQPTPPAPQNPDGPQDSRVGMIGSARVELAGDAIREFESARRLVTVSLVCSIVSFFIGGIMLSTVAIVCAAIAFGKLNRIARGLEEPQAQRALRRIGVMAIGLAAFALVVNIATLFVLYPLLMDNMQSGGFGSLLGGGSASTAGGNSTWG